ncbi:hypothetical protein MKW98_015422 [Papaver atlanticum]|uniref:Uncharacterized protein n=1 Tax=Papaver atlanticum TaxID=357466 RepID=A0AAD4RYP5_9MAGN|nr:hypothetical protein MKW98_015422 [Papaver atlanticum]
MFTVDGRYSFTKHVHGYSKLSIYYRLAIYSLYRPCSVYLEYAPFRDDIMESPTKLHHYQHANVVVGEHNNHHDSSQKPTATDGWKQTPSLFY